VADQPISDDGMWRWDGMQWQPTEKNLAARSQAETATDAQHAARSHVSADTGVLAESAPTDSSLVPVVASPTHISPTRADRRAERKAARADRRADAKARHEMLALARSPAGKARAAFERGDQVFQCSFDVMSQQPVIVIMVGSATTKKTNDTTETLNAVSREGWELITGSFVFVEEGQQSRDKFLSSGQNVATKGRTMGYYLFKRNETLLVRASSEEDLLDVALDEASEEDEGSDA
jgi:hypothetical protein